MSSMSCPESKSVPDKTSCDDSEKKAGGGEGGGGGGGGPTSSSSSSSITSSNICSSSSSSSKIFFKKRNIRNRGRRKSEKDDQSDDEDESSKLLETLEKQKLRERKLGINALALNSGIKATDHELALVKGNPFKLKSGGLLDYKTAQRAQQSQKEEEDASIVGTQFSKETRIRDEDEEMRKFIENEMKNRRCGGDNDDLDPSSKKNSDYLSPEDKALRSLPEHLSTSTFRKNEEMLSSQMLSGIPEVDLGIDEKIRNIEATEVAKKRQKLNKDEKMASEFVPKNMTVNFAHNNYKKSFNNRNAKTNNITIERTCVVGNAPEERIVEADENSKNYDSKNRATDDLHLTNFKKQFQRK